MFTKQVRQIDALPPPPNSDFATAAWWERTKTTMVQTFGDCNQELEHNGPIVLNDIPGPTTIDENGNEIPLPPFTPDQINFHNETALPPANFTLDGGDSVYDIDQNLITGGLTQINGGVSVFEYLIVKEDVRILGDLFVEGKCNCGSPSDPNPPTGAGTEIERFRLLDPLARKGTANAVILARDSGGSYVPTATVVSVKSLFGQHGSIGSEGWCVFKADMAVGTREALWLENQPVRFKLLANLAIVGTAQARQVVLLGGSLQEVGDPFLVESWNGKWSGRTGALGTAIWFQDDASSAKVIDLDHDAEWIVVRAKQDMPASGVLNAELVRFSRGREPVAVGAAITVYDPDKEFALVKNGALLYCVLHDLDGHYHIQRGAAKISVPNAIRYDTETHSIQVQEIDLTVHCHGDPKGWEAAIPFTQHTPLVNWRIDGLNYQTMSQPVYVIEIDAAGGWETKVTGGLCS